MNRLHLPWKIALAICLTALLAAPVFAAEEDEKELPWDKTFNGHEMWMTDLGKALELSLVEKKPLLIDIYSRH